MLNDLKKSKALEYNKINDPKIFHSSTKLIANAPDIDEAFNDKNKKILLRRFDCDR